MILFFKTPQQSVIATEVDHQLNPDEVKNYAGSTAMPRCRTQSGWTAIS